MNCVYFTPAVTLLSNTLKKSVQKDLPGQDTSFSLQSRGGEVYPRKGLQAMTYVFRFLFLSGAACLTMSSAFLSSAADEDPFMQTRHQMVRQQIQSRGISSPEVLQAMRRVKRHLFVPASLRGSAYADRPLPIGHGQTISQPFIVAFMTEALKIKKTDSVLEIGTGSGYQAAVLAEIANEVYSIEIIEELALTAQRVLKSLGYQNVTVKTGDGYAGWAEHAPFDAIIVTAAPEDIPQKLVDQLAEGGRMVIPVGTQFQELLFIEKTLDRVITTSLLPVRFVPMVHPNSKKEFPSKQPGTDFN